MDHLYFILDFGERLRLQMKLYMRQNAYTHSRANFQYFCEISLKDIFTIPKGTHTVNPFVNYRSLTCDCDRKLLKRTPWCLSKYPKARLMNDYKYGYPVLCWVYDNLDNRADTICFTILLQPVGLGRSVNPGMYNDLFCHGDILTFVATSNPLLNSNTAIDRKVIDKKRVVI